MTYPNMGPVIKTEKRERVRRQIRATLNLEIIERRQRWGEKDLNEITGALGLLEVSQRVAEHRLPLNSSEPETSTESLSGLVKPRRKRSSSSRKPKETTPAGAGHDSVA